MLNIEQYNPLQWPPDIKLAELHYNCSKPGIDNTEGSKCPCCDRYEKLQNSQWPRRDIAKDFKNYGGGIPGYFFLIIYFVCFLLLLTLIKVIYHIITLETICPFLQNDPERRCTKIFNIFKFCSANILYEQAVSLGYETQAKLLQYLNLITYIILIAATIGIKIFLQYLNKDKISLDQKLFSKFSLIIKNVPLYYQIQDLKQELKEIDPKIQINQMFYLHKYCKYQQLYRQIFDLYFKIHHLEEQSKTDDRQKKIEILRKEYQRYIQLYDQVNDSTQIKNNSKKILIVFNTIEQKQNIHARLRMNSIIKFTHYFFRLFKSKIQPIGYYSQRVTEPQEIIWRNIGQSSTKKQKVRIQTTIIGVGFMIISFAILYFPMYKIDQQKVDKPGLGTALGTLISIIIIALSVFYRRIIVGLMPTRRPSSKLAEAFFIILTTIVFHFFFYVVTPAAFYIFAQSIPANEKLKEFFSAVFLFSLMVLLVATLDLKYRLFNKKKQRLIGQVSESYNYCQQRLHEELTPPSFPIQFKLMVIFNIWTFNSFYIFEIPYLIFLFMIILIVLYWIDKRNLYLHYKMQQYISIELEVKVQKTYIVFFLICVSGGYYFTSIFIWEKITIGIIFILALIINFTLNFTYKKQKDNILRHNTNLKNAIQESKQSFAMISHINLMEQQLKNSFLVPPVLEQFSSVSLATELISYGYLQTYKLFKNQFKNKIFNQMLSDKYLIIRKSKTILDAKKIRENEMPNYNNNELKQPLLEDKIQQGQNKPQINIIYHNEESQQTKNHSKNQEKVRNDSLNEVPIKIQNIPQTFKNPNINSINAQDKLRQSSQFIKTPHNNLILPDYTLISKEQLIVKNQSSQKQEK